MRVTPQGSHCGILVECGFLMLEGVGMNSVVFFFTLLERVVALMRYSFEIKQGTSLYLI